MPTLNELVEEYIRENEHLGTHLELCRTMAQWEQACNVLRDFAAYVDNYAPELVITTREHYEVNCIDEVEDAVNTPLNP